ncbi:MAG: putative maltokinase, partial [Chloroflexota bacterium]
ANQWPEDAVEYFGDGDECHMAFHFPVMPRLYMALRMEDHFPIIDILEQTPEIPETSQWAMFLRNHDELTLEMVTDEERDYMYRAYAHDPDARINLGIRRRLAPLMNNNRRRIELMNGLLFSLPGTPVIYYGDEIGMGDNIYLGDRNGVRTPMQWSADRNAGFSAANRQKLYFPVIVDPEYHYETVNVEIQQQNPQSLLWWMKRIIDLRRRYKAFGQGSIEFLNVSNRKILAFVRSFRDERILVVANLSRFSQAVELDLSEYQGMMPVEMFGRTEFPPIGELPYFVTLSPHGFYWFSLEPQRTTGDYEAVLEGPRAIPEVSVRGGWDRIFEGTARRQLLGLLPGYLQERRWFGGKARTIRGLQLTDLVDVSYDGGQARVCFVSVDYTEGDSETYLLPLTFVIDERARQLEEWLPHTIVARLSAGGESGVLCDALWEPGFGKELLRLIGRRRSPRGRHGRIRGVPNRRFRELRKVPAEQLQPTVGQAEQSNSSIIFDEEFILKIFRRVDEGENPDLEIGRFLTESTNFSAIAPVAGSIAYERNGRTSTLGILQGFVPNEGDAWAYTLDVLGSYIEENLAMTSQDRALGTPGVHALDLIDDDLPEDVYDVVGPYIDDAIKLGQRTAEMHLALASGTGAAFRPEEFSMLGQRALYQSMRSQSGRVFQTLRRAISGLPEIAREEAQWVLSRQSEVQERFRALTDHRIDAMNTRTHGDYHLGQVLFTGRDFVIIDFEGEPARPLGERRLKRSPLRDVAGMIRSFDYAAHANLYDRGAGAPVREDDMEVVERLVQQWNFWVSVAYLKGYFERAEGAKYLPTERDDLRILLEAFILEKAVYELGYELNNRPGWVRIPTRGIAQLLEERK